MASALLQGWGRRGGKGVGGIDVGQEWTLKVETGGGGGGRRAAGGAGAGGTGREGCKTRPWKCTLPRIRAPRAFLGGDFFDQDSTSLPQPTRQLEFALRG